ncbi:MAG: hypothetical protein RMM98_14580 [Acidobacteriota bacterium]|nr:hypothetical protein [Blastocatellia bacterium]MDW8240832.1 hypothetical protein [Acidobacteriota bacterium]
MRTTRNSRLSWFLIGLTTVGWSFLLGDFSLAKGQSGNPLQATVRQGTVVVRHVGSKPVVAFNGVFTYRSPKGHVATPTFTHSFLGTWFEGRGSFRPGQEVRFPPISPPDDSSLTYEYLDAAVTGVLFADGTTWGSTGDSLRRSMLARAGAICAKLNDILNVIKDNSLEEVEQLLRGPGPIIQGQELGEWLHRVLRKELLNQNGEIYPDALNRLRRMITHLEGMIDR